MKVNHENVRDKDEPVISWGNGFGEAVGGISGASGCARRSMIFWREWLPVEQTEAVDVKVSGVVRGIFRAEVSISSIAPAVASEFEGAEVLRLFAAGLGVGKEEGRMEITLSSSGGTSNVGISYM